MWLNSKALTSAKLKIVALERFWFEDINGEESHAEDLTTLTCSVLHAAINEMHIRHEHNDKDAVAP